MVISEGLALAGAAVAAGAVNAVAGGGTLLTFPTLLFFGTGPVVANATSTLALVIGTAGGVFGYRQHIAAIRSWLWRFLPVSLCGGFLGSYWLTRTSDKAFAKLVPFLILFATLLFLAQGAFRKWQTNEREPASRGKLWAALLFQFAVAIYGGYFGAGIGILMLASLGFIGLRDIHEMNALKTILGSLINLVAAGWFVYAGLVNWPKAAVMTAGALAGYFIGSHYSQRISQGRVRQIITTIGIVLSGFTFYKEFVR
jgi:uncharacterized membrane protein YfcA